MAEIPGSADPLGGTTVRAASAAVGRLVGGRYRLVERIGVGGSATIFRALDETLERDVAVKLLHPHLADDDDLLARFRTEGRHAAALLHPNIVHVYDQGIDDQPYLVMEFVDGPSLRDVLHAKGRLTPPEVLAIVEPVCSALARAHDSGVVHRDLKPENVLVSADGAPKVADFGIARAVAETHHTQTGALVGSVHYLAPELVGGTRASPASDQYALGVVVFELLTGRKALPAETPMAVALRHAREAIPEPSAFVSDVSGALDKVVRRATASEPADRFPDMAAFAAALRRAVPGGPRPVTVARPTDNGRDDTVVIPADGGTLVGASVADTDLPPAGTSRRRRDEHPAEPGVPPRSRRRRAVLLALSALVGLVLLAGGGLATWHYVVAPFQPVPDLTEGDQAAAADELAAWGFQLDVAGSRHDRVEPAGSVLEQDPAPGSQLRRGQAVSVVVSDGPAPVDMPEVFNLTREEAERLLTGEPYFFTIARVDEAYSDHAPAGVVIGQLPEPEAPMRQGDEVVLNVSLGVEQVTVPDLVRLSREEAEQLLAEARLRGDFVEEYSDEVATAGRVVEQSLAPDSEVDKNSTVRVVVSKGPLTIRTPRVEGKTVEDASAELRALDLVPVVIKEPRPRVGPFRKGEFGRVEAQNPQPGEPVQRGQRVELYTFAEDDEVG